MYEAFEKIGFLLTSYMPPNPHTHLNEKLFISILKTKISKTFNDRDKLLFQNMLDMILYKSKNNSSENYFYGTKSFHVVWEKMVDVVYGIDKSSLDNFQPHIIWNIKGNETYSPLIPDTIMMRSCRKNKIYVLDSKYYKAGVDLDYGKLPAAESVPKQIVYAEKIKKQYKKHIIYNAFILPYDSKNDDVPMEYLGHVRPDWIDENKINTTESPFYKIQAIKVDTRNLMYNHFPADDKLFTDMANIIENGVYRTNSSENIRKKQNIVPHLSTERNYLVADVNADEQIYQQAKDTTDNDVSYNIRH